MQRLDGVPLIVRAARKLQRLACIDEVYVDTDDSGIAEAVEVPTLMRDPELAHNGVDGNWLLLNEARQVDADIYVQYLCTSPFVRDDTIAAAIAAVAGGAYESAFLMRQESLHRWEGHEPVFSLDPLPNTCDLPPTQWDTTGLYVITKEALLKYRRRIVPRRLAILVSPVEAVDIDYPEDLEFAEWIAKGQTHHALQSSVKVPVPRATGQ